jgi:ribonuclease VapC
VIIDSSAIVAIGLSEPESDLFVQAISQARTCRMSGGTWVELAAVAVRRKLFTPAWLEKIVKHYEIVIEPVTAEQAQIGHAAYLRFGIGSGHPARLNFGDCFAYSLADMTGEPLLFKGDGFAHTDVMLAVRSAP